MDLQYEYAEINPGDCVTVRLSETICIQGCMVLCKTHAFGKVLYTVAVPTGEKTERDDIGCLANSLVFMNGYMWVRWENIDSVFVLGG